MKLGWMTWMTMLGALAAAGCGVKASEEPAVHSAATFGNMVPDKAPIFTGTYDFDMMGFAQGVGCAEWGEWHGPYREVLVNGRADSYSVAMAGATLDSPDPRVQQAQAAAAFAAVSKLPGADVIVLTRSVVQSDSPTRVCATVAGQVIRLKKGPTLAGEHGTSPTSTAPSAADAPVPSPATPPATPPAH